MEEPIFETDVSSVPNSKPVNIFQRQITLNNYYSFLRAVGGNKSPKKGQNKEYVFDPIEDEEDIMVYFDRCHRDHGARPAPIGPMKKYAVNSPCICKSGKKYKKCCINQ